MPILRALTFDDVLLVPNYGNESRDDGDVSAALGRYKYSIPVISANMDSITGPKMAAAMTDAGGLGILHRFMTVDENVLAFRQTAGFTISTDEVGVSIGVGEKEQERAEALYSAGAQLFCIDIAHAHSKQMGKMIKWLRTEYKDVYIIAGNVATYSGADYLVSCGADAVKVGIGAGSVCTTREVTGFGVPQLTAIMDCARIDKPIIADGGMRTSGDIVKALAAGATMVMLGGMLAGTDESLGGWTYRGMASQEARQDYYRFDTGSGYRVAEGVSVDVFSRGPVTAVLAEIVGGIKSGLSYAGAKNLDDLRRKAQFIEITPATEREGRPHAIR